MSGRRRSYEIREADSDNPLDIGETTDLPNVGDLITLGLKTYRVGDHAIETFMEEGRFLDHHVFEVTVEPDNRPSIAIHRSLRSWKLTDGLRDLLIDAGISLTEGSEARRAVSRSNLDATLILTRDERDGLRAADAFNSALLVVDWYERTLRYYRGPAADPTNIPFRELSGREAEEILSGHSLLSPRSSRRRFSDSEVVSLFEVITILLGSRQVILPAPPQVVVADSFAYYNDLLKRISLDISDLHRLTPRQFEEFIAEMLDRDGFEVRLTKQTRDGGIDIFASKQERFGRVVYGYECKKYRSDRPLGVGIVRELATATTDNGCNLGVLCTTSTFSAEAIALARRTNLVYPQDVNDLHRWVIELSQSRR